MIYFFRRVKKPSLFGNYPLSRMLKNSTYIVVVDRLAPVFLATNLWVVNYIAIVFQLEFYLAFVLDPVLGTSA